MPWKPGRLSIRLHHLVDGYVHRTASGLGKRE